MILGTKDNPVPTLSIQRAMKSGPPHGQLEPGQAPRRRGLPPPIQGFLEPLVVVQLLKPLGQALSVEPALPGLDLGARLGQEATCDRGVGVDGDAQLAQDGKEVVLGEAGDGGVVALVDGRKDPSV